MSYQNFQMLSATIPDQDFDTETDEQDKSSELNEQISKKTKKRAKATSKNTVIAEDFEKLLKGI
ncbi:hypothetical protein [Hufsiella ginkgonis]|uniref:Uncharacterized protein n=1 Tax=Hufsiella ginkgonis TaxID=2695274 RepID=A0A7K1Y1D0_9SPHI|nr:hypothetical protein [Hufsiella ginkgonis]MXV16829.1 hypothetical protein [Hufsiella ginkgonis]